MYLIVSSSAPKVGPARSFYIPDLGIFFKVPRSSNLEDNRAGPRIEGVFNKASLLEYGLVRSLTLKIGKLTKFKNASRLIHITVLQLDVVRLAMFIVLRCSSPVQLSVVTSVFTCRVR